jgi:hypothetical protein
MNLRRVALPIYALAASILLVLALFTYVVVQDVQHDHDLARISAARQVDSNAFFRAVCDKFEIRDEIVLSLIRPAHLRALAQGERVYADILENATIALETAQGDCDNQIPQIRPVPNP